MGRLQMDKRGVTPVLSNVLLTIVAVAAMSMAASASYLITDNLRQRMGERVIIEDVWFDSSNRVSIYLRNTGKVAITASSVYINYTSQPLTALTLEVGEHGWLYIVYRWSSDSLYHINIVTERGTKIVDYYLAP